MRHAVLAVVVAAACSHPAPRENASKRTCVDTLEVDRYSVAVDAGAALPGLTPTSVTHLAPGTSVRVGQIDAAARGGRSGRELLRALVSTGVLKTFDHIGATVCVEDEKDAGGVYTARVSGVHVYYTNQKNEGRYVFTFRVGGDGVVTVTGIERG